MKERSYDKTFDSRYQEGEEGLQDTVGVGNAGGEGYPYGMGEPMDVVMGIQPCPFVYLVNGMYIIVMLTA